LTTMENTVRVDCDVVAMDELAERYLLGGLAPAEQDAYERHFFQCTRCAEELEQLLALQRALQRSARSADAVMARPARARAPARWTWLALAATVAAVALLLTVGRRPEQIAQAPVPRQNPPSVSPVLPPADASLPQPMPAARPTAPSVRDSVVTDRAHALARLARVDPPRYSPLILRGVADDATVAFENGMKDYVAGDYRAALRQLRQAAGLDPERVDIAFFLAASELLSGNTAAAVPAFQAVIALGDSPFLEEARFYLAKSYLAMGDVSRARTEFARVRDMGGDLAGAAGEIDAQLSVLAQD